MSMMWVAIGTAAVGTATTLYGANKQSKDNAHAQDLNMQAQDRQNNANWTNWLMTRGIQPTSPVNAGTVPQAGGYTAVNTKLPLWANVNVGTRVAGIPGGGGTGIKLVKKGMKTTTGIMGLAPTASSGINPTNSSPGSVANITGGNWNDSMHDNFSNPSFVLG